MQKAGSALTSVIVILVVVAAILLAGIRVLGYTPYTVLSSSMIPEFHAGDLVYVKRTAPERIESGMILAFVANEDFMVVTHRVLEADHENRQFITKGDANDSRDMYPVLYENVLGVVRFSVPKLGYLSHYLSSESGRYTGITILFIFILFLVLQEIFPRKNTQVNKRQKKIMRKT